MLLRMNEVFKMNATQFLFVSEYLLKKNKIEADEQKRQLDSIKNRR